MTRPVVTDRSQIAENIDYLRRLVCGAQEDQAFVRSLVKLGQNFVEFGKGRDRFFAPSRFVGYPDNSKRKHRPGSDRHGGKTSTAIRRLLGEEIHSQEAEQRFLAFCRSLAIAPKRAIANPRKYWRLLGRSSISITSLNLDSPAIDIVFHPNQVFRENEDQIAEMQNYCRRGYGDWSCKKTARSGDIYFFYFSAPRTAICALGVCDSDRSWKERGEWYCRFTDLVWLREPVGKDTLSSDSNLEIWWSKRPYRGRPKSIDLSSAAILGSLISGLNPKFEEWFISYAPAAVSSRIANERVRVITKQVAQGRNLSPEERKAIELHAMERASQHFETRGYTWKDVSHNSSYDLRCNNASGVIFVEVKGTKSIGNGILLTPKEVEFARKNRKRMVLFIQHSIQVRSGRNGVKASGGASRILENWNVDAGDLKPTGFEYRPNK